MPPICATSKDHIDRKKYNHCPKSPPQKNDKGDYVCSKNKIWEKDNVISSSLFHGYREGYRTWRTPAPISSYPGAGWQCTYKDGKLVDSGENMGTFDYGAPGTAKHFKLDVIPHLKNPHYTPNLTGQY